MRLPKEGDFITIQSYKHDGSLHRTWRDTMVGQVITVIAKEGDRIARFKARLRFVA